MIDPGVTANPTSRYSDDGLLLDGLLYDGLLLHGLVDHGLLLDGLVERQRELTELDGALAAAHRGAGGVVVVEGGPGSGKSSLLRVAEAKARAAGMGVLAARAAEFEGDFSFGVATRLLGPAVSRLAPDARLRSLSGRAAAAAALFDPEAAEVAADGPAEERALVRALRQLTSNFLVAAPDSYPSLVLTLDDAQWADAASLRFLASLAVDSTHSPILVIVAAEQAATEGCAEIRRGLGATAGTRRLRLEALSEDGVRLLARRVIPDAPPGFVTECARVTGGNPFYVHELLATARPEGLNVDFDLARTLDGRVPVAVADAVLLRLARLVPAAAPLAVAVAVLGEGASMHLAATLAGLSLEAAEAAAASLAEAEVLAPERPLHFAQPLTGIAVYHAAPALSRSRLHRRAAELLDAAGASPSVISSHLLACLPRGDAATVRFTRITARRALDLGDAPLAQRLLDQVLSEPPPPELRLELLVDRAMAHCATATPDALGHVRGSLALADTPEQRAELFSSLARLLFARAEFAAATEAVEQALKELPPGDAREAELLVASMVIAYVSASEPPAAASGRLEELLHTGYEGQISEPGLLALVATAMLAAGRPAPDVADAAQRALEGLPVNDGLYGVLNGCAVLPLLVAGELEAASSRAEACRSDARAAGVPIRLGMASHWLSLAYYYRGDLDAAIATGRGALDTIKVGWDICTGWLVPLLAHAYMDRGDLPAAAEVLRRAAKVAPDRPEQLMVRTARALLAHLEGDDRSGAEELLAIGPALEVSGIANAALVPWRSLAAMAALHLGDTKRALELAEEELARARAFGEPRVLGIALRTAGVVRAGPAGLELLAEAVDVLEASPAAMERAHALVEYGAALRRAGKQVASRAMSRRGLELARSLGAAPLALQAEVELHAAGGRYRTAAARFGVAALTPAERRVAELAADGLSTPLLARKLHLAPKTVDWHLGNVYRKMGISSRRLLADALAANRST